MVAAVLAVFCLPVTFAGAIAAVAVVAFGTEWAVVAIDFAVAAGAIAAVAVAIDVAIVAVVAFGTEWARSSVSSSFSCIGFLFVL